MYKDIFKLKGIVTMVLKNKDGEIIPIFEANKLWKFFNKHFELEFELESIQDTEKYTKD